MPTLDNEKAEECEEKYNKITTMSISLKYLADLLSNKGIKIVIFYLIRMSSWSCSFLTIVVAFLTMILQVAKDNSGNNHIATS